jgi:hypothetical protein
MADTPFGRLEGFKVTIEPCAPVVAYLYKGEWHMRELDPDCFGPRSHRGWDAQHNNLGGWAD